MDAELARILDPQFLDGLQDRPVDELRDLREVCQVVETQLSYLRRLVQGRHDIVAGELDRRRSGGAKDDVHGLVERLPEILADRIHAPGAGRLPVGMEPGELSGSLVDRLDDIGEVVTDASHAASDDELTAAADALTALEQDVSAMRRAMFDRIDTLQAEITRRYKDGSARVDDLLAGGS
jgi:hypothetical protein